MTRNEVWRTAFNKINPKKSSPFGNTHPEKDANTMCPYCKNENTDRIVDQIDLAPFKDYWKNRDFQAISCFMCGAKWSFGG